MNRVISGAFPAILIGVVLAACRGPDYPRNDFPAEDCYTVGTAYFTAQLLRPDNAPLRSDNGRFLPGGWLLSLKNRNGEELLEQNSIVAGQYAYGCPLEFADVIADASGKLIRIGVGEVFRPAGDPGFGDVVVRRYAWHSRKVVRDGETEVHFYQFAGQQYFFHIAVSFRGESDTIRYELNFHNISGREIASEFYWHPFLRYFGNRSWYRLENGEQQRLPLKEYLVEEIAATPLAGVSAGRDDAVLLTFETSPPQWKTVLWKDKAVFSVEPYGLLRVPAARKMTFRWSIRIHSEE